MKILMCNKFHFRAGGTETYLFDLCQGLSALGHTVINFSTHDARNLPSAYSEYFVNAADLSGALSNNLFINIRRGVNFVYSTEAARKIGHLIDEQMPEIAHIHNIYHHLSSSVLNVLHKKRTPVVMTLHDYKLICPNYSLFNLGAPCARCKGHKYYNAVRYKCLKDSYSMSGLACLEMYFCKILKIYENNVGLFIAPSKFIRDKAISFGIKAAKVIYLPYALDLENFTPNFELGNYILYLGNISDKKGIVSLLKCIREAHIRIPLKVIGGGPLKEKMAAFIRQERLANVEFLGYLPRSELADFIRNALFVIVPSLWYEVAGLVIYEAFACGKCVIGSGRGGIPELIEDGVSGLLFDPARPAELSEKISYLIDNPEKVIELGKRAYWKIKDFNNKQRHYQELLDIYSALSTK